MTCRYKHKVARYSYGLALVLATGSNIDQKQYFNPKNHLVNVKAKGNMNVTNLVSRIIYVSNFRFIRKIFLKVSNILGNSYRFRVKMSQNCFKYSSYFISFTLQC